MSRPNLLFVDRTGGAVFRLTYLTLSERYRLYLVDSRERALAVMQRVTFRRVVFALNEPSIDDSLAMMGLRDAGLLVVASCLSAVDAAALRMANACETLTRPHSSSQLAALVARPA